MEFQDGDFWCGHRRQHHRRHVPEPIKPYEFGLNDWAKCFVQSNVPDTLAFSTHGDPRHADENDLFIEHDFEAAWMMSAPE